MPSFDIVDPPDSNSLDPQLRPFLTEADDKAAEILLRKLYLHTIEPVVRRIVEQEYSVRVQLHASNEKSADQLDAAEAFSLAVYAVYHKLRGMKKDGSRIANLDNYVAKIAYNSCAGQLQLKYPNRYRVALQLRQLLKKTPAIAEWEVHSVPVIGLESWMHHRMPVRRGSSQVVSMFNSPLSVIRKVYPDFDVDRHNTLTAVLLTIKQPVAKSDVIEILGELWELRDEHSVALIEPDDDQQGITIAGSQNIFEEVFYHTTLEKLWADIESLTTQQAAALLLSIGGATLTEIARCGICSLTAMAEVMGFEPAVFAKILKNPPRTDHDIAQYLNVSVSRVTDLRTIARRKLTRHAKFLDKQQNDAH